MKTVKMQSVGRNSSYILTVFARLRSYTMFYNQTSQPCEAAEKSPTLLSSNFYVYTRPDFLHYN